MYQTTYFVAYSLICGLLAFGLAGILHRTANLFVRGRAGEAPRMLLSVARLLAAGFYLACCGYFAMTCPTDWRFTNLADIAHAISLKAGFFLLLLGAMVVINSLVLVFLDSHAREAS